MNMSESTKTFTAAYLKEWESLCRRLSSKTEPVRLDGKSLNLSSIISISRHDVSAEVDEPVLHRLAISANRLKEDLQNGHIIYGVNTGIGGSANTRTQQHERLQANLVSMQHCGVLYPMANKSGEAAVDAGHPVGLVGQLQKGLPVEDRISANCMPESWIRAAILIRINSLVHGASSVRPVIVERLLDLLRLNLLPRVPMHGSISASGDLSPLSYIAGTLQGKRHITMLSGQTGRLVTADDAMKEAGVAPISLGAKEGLALMNGTAFSSGVGALLMHDVLGLCALSQVLTALSVEALHGSSESFNPFFAKLCPHAGQIESSRNILGLLQNSRFIANKRNPSKGGLQQDRYSIRTASQWIGPVLEDCLAAYHQVIIDCNSVTDNPLTDDAGHTFQGGNFQAKAITSAAEKARQGLQSLGRMLFTQSTELINPATNNGLPPNLTIDPPSQSFIFKGVDVFCASLVSELGFLANPVGTHVQTAEMGNQAINSLALISVRYTHSAADLLSKLCAAHLLIVCQALDLRDFHVKFLAALEKPFRSINFTFWHEHTSVEKLQPLLENGLNAGLDSSNGKDPEDRFRAVASSLKHVAFSHFDTDGSLPMKSILTNWAESITELLQKTYDSTLLSFLQNGSASDHLGNGTRPMYEFVRKTLGVPFLTEEVLQGPCLGVHDKETGKCEANHFTIGDYITKIHNAIRQGILSLPVTEALRNTHVDLERDQDR